MTAPDDESKLVEEDLYLRSFSDINTLHSQLPEEVVAALAREVLEGLARQLSETSVPDATIVSLCDALIGPDARAAAKMIDDRLRDGTDVNRLYLEYLAPAAALLGLWWEQDKITFADVTVGSGRIYAVMRSLHRRTTKPRVTDQRSAFFAPVPNDDHTLGVKMAADLARKDGWDISFDLSCTHDEIIARVVEEDIGLLGLSGGGEHAVPNLARLVLALRIHAPNTMIVVSGNVIDTSGESIRLMQVDGMGRDYPTAIAALERLWLSAKDSGI